MSKEGIEKAQKKPNFTRTEASGRKRETRRYEESAWKRYLSGKEMPTNSKISISGQWQASDWKAVEEAEKHKDSGDSDECWRCN